MEPKSYTVIGYGSLLSEKSARATFSQVLNFRLAYVHGFRRLFRHPAGFFYDCGLVSKENPKAYCSLSLDPHPESKIMVTVFEILESEYENLDEREAEYNLVEVDYTELTGKRGKAIACLPSSDDDYRKRFGDKKFEEKYARYGFETIWGLSPDSGALPCTVYLRHCILSARGQSQECGDNFLDSTFLIDRNTSIRAYLEAHPEVLEAVPPECVKERYNGP